MIEQVLNVLEKIAEQVERTGVLPQQDAADAVEFFRMFADQCHHGKEEAELFPALEAKGFPRHGGPTGVMIQEHEFGRARVRGMAAAIEQDAAGEFVRNARAFIEMLRQHIQKEDHCLFPMADETLTGAEQGNLLVAFERAEKEQMGPGTHETMLALAESLARKYDVSVQSHAVSHACGHH